VCGLLKKNNLIIANTFQAWVPWAVEKKKKTRHICHYLQCTSIYLFLSLCNYWYVMLITTCHNWNGQAGNSVV